MSKFPRCPCDSCSEQARIECMEMGDEDTCPRYQKWLAKGQLIKRTKNSEENQDQEQANAPMDYRPYC